MITLYSKPYQGALAPSTPAAVPATNESSRFADQLQEISQQVDTTKAAPISMETPQTTLQDIPASTAKSTQSPPALASDTSNSTPGASAAVKNFIEWQGMQPNPFGQGTIADVWTKQGITDPLSNPVLISQAQNQLNRADQRSAMNPNYVAEWKGDWKTQMAQAKASENQRQTFMAAADALGNVTVGGGIVRMVG